MSDDNQKDHTIFTDQGSITVSENDFKMPCIGSFNGKNVEVNEKSEKALELLEGKVPDLSPKELVKTWSIILIEENFEGSGGKTGHKGSLAAFAIGKYEQNDNMLFTSDIMIYEKRGKDIYIYTRSGSVYVLEGGGNKTLNDKNIGELRRRLTKRGVIL